jgi:hypothetical protein
LASGAAGVSWTSRVSRHCVISQIRGGK